MFNIGQIVVVKNSGVCSIVSKEKMNFGMGETEYFVLKPYFSNANSTKLYIPEDKAVLNLRELVSREQVINLINSMPGINKVWYNDSKIRKQKFEEMYKSGDLKLLCQLVKSLYLQNEELKLNKKTLSIIDREFLDKIQAEIYQEFAVALQIKPEEVEGFIKAQGVL